MSACCQKNATKSLSDDVVDLHFIANFAHDAYWKRVRVWVRCASASATKFWHRAEQSTGQWHHPKKNAVSNLWTSTERLAKAKRERTRTFHSIQFIHSSAQYTTTTTVDITFRPYTPNPTTTNHSLPPPPHNTSLHEFHRHRGKNIGLRTSAVCLKNVVLREPCEAQWNTKLTNACLFYPAPFTIVRRLRINIFTRRPSLPGRICWKGSREQWVRKTTSTEESKQACTRKNTSTGTTMKRPFTHVFLSLNVCVSYRTAIGIRVKDGVVLAVEKLIQSKLLVPGANRRIQNVDRHVGIVRRADTSRYSCSVDLTFCPNHFRVVSFCWVR